ncbi:LytR C-terminal domain-containing protein [Candidatus Nomurabacteria bacterium]|nr:LytR C-terminal domain-containing protein [Candidatus Nomurabacteria bacterium]
MARSKRISYRANSTKNKRSKKKAALKTPIGGLILAVGVVLGIFFILQSIKATLDSYRGVRIEDPVKSDEKLLFDKNEGVQKTLFVFETPRSGGGSEIASLYLFAENKNNAQSAAFFIPGWVYIPVEGSDLATVSSIRNLSYFADLTSSKKPYSYFIWEVQNVLGVKIDDYVWVREDASSALGETFESESTEGLEFFARFLRVTQITRLITKQDQTSIILRNIYSDLSPVGLYNLTGQISDGLKQENLTFIDFTDGDYLVEKTLDSGDTVSLYNQVAADKVILDLDTVFVDRSIEKEQAKVEVYNGSEINGLASRYARVIQNAGLPVVRSENSPDSYKETVVYVSVENKFVSSLELVQSLIPVDAKVIVGRPDFLTTADIMVILGDDVTNEYTW